MFRLVSGLLEKILAIYPQNKIAISVLNFSVELFSKISKSYPKNKEIMFVLGRLCFLKDDYDKSIEWLEKISFLSQKDREAMLFLAMLYVLKEDYEKSIICVLQVLGIYPIQKEILEALLKEFEKIEKQINYQIVEKFDGIYETVKGTVEKIKDQIILREVERLKPQIPESLTYSMFTDMISNLTPISIEFEKAGLFRESQSLLFVIIQLQKSLQKRFTTQQTMDMGEIQDRLVKLANKIQHQEAELIRSRQMAALGVMASGLAHEINQPLQIILARAQNCISDIKCNAIDTSGIINDFEHITNTVRRIDKIVNHLHVLSRDRKLELKEVNINDVIHNSLIMFQQQLKNRGIAVELNLTDNLLPVMADMVQLEQVFINLINNSRDTLEESSEDKKITITTQAVNGKIEVRFHDNGKGVAPEDSEKIFNAFYTTKQKGVGLGLYISQDIIRNYGGTIMAESKINEGTTFIIHLPIAGKETDL